MIGGVIVRALLVVAALAAGIWCATSLRAAMLEADAREVLTANQTDFASFLREATPERLAEAADLFGEARDWAPYQTEVPLEAALLARSGREDQAVQLIEDLVRREPDNPDGWAALAALSAESDPARAAEARRRVRVLNPPVERP
jgi:predicted Zn-dependent protease